MKEIIKKRRKELNMTQQELGELLNISDRVISKWETGVSVPDTSMLQPLCKVLGISVNDLLNSSLESTKDSVKEAIIKEQKVKYKNLSIITIVMEVLVGFLIATGRYISSNESSIDYYTRRNIGIALYIVAIVITIISIAIILLLRNKVTSKYSDVVVMDKKYTSIVIITSFVITLIDTFIFVILHGLEWLEIVIIFSIYLLIIALIFGALYLLNKKR